jgi:zinc protease
VFTEMKVLEKALNLSMYELLGDAGMINDEIENYGKVGAADIMLFAQQQLVPQNCSTLYYHMKG